MNICNLQSFAFGKAVSHLLKIKFIVISLPNQIMILADEICNEFGN